MQSSQKALENPSSNPPLSYKEGKIEIQLKITVGGGEENPSAILIAARGLFKKTHTHSEFIPSAMRGLNAVTWR